jgi:hypothetical protein
VNVKGKKLGEILLESGLIDKYQLASAIGKQKEGHGKLASVLVQMKYVDEKTVASELEKQLGVSCVSVEDIEVPDDVLSMVKSEIAEKYRIMPLAFDQKILTLAMQDPTDLETVDELSFNIGVNIKPVLALESAIKKAITKHYPDIIFSGPQIYTIDRETIPEKMELMTEEKTSSHVSYPPEKAIEVILDILIEKDITTKFAFTNKIRKKMKND